MRKSPVRQKSTMDKLSALGRHREPKVSSKDREKVGNLMKKRYSVRAPHKPSQHHAPMPTMVEEDKKLDTENRKAPLIDIADFERPDFNVNAYVDQLLSVTSPEGIIQIVAQLSERQKASSEDRQFNATQSHDKYVVISKEISDLESEMANLRGLMCSLRLLTESISKNAETQFFMDKSATKRSSLADLDAIYATQLKTLWNNVEGSQKLIPALPGRHIVKESPSWVELNAATWKPRQGVHMFLLNDCLLVAIRRRRKLDDLSRQKGDVRLIAERCWPIAELQIAQQVDDTITIQVGKESFIYRTDKPTEKAEFMTAFRKVSADLKKAMKAETEEQLRKRDSMSYFTSRDPILRQHTNFLKKLSDALISKETALWIDGDGKHRNIRWLEDRMDELDVQIHHHNFEDAVCGIEKGRKLVSLNESNSLASEWITFKLDVRASQLCAIICHDLQGFSANKKSIKSDFDWLSRIGYMDRAWECYLSARSKLLKSRGRMLRFDGNISQYICNLSIIYFSLLRNTVQILQSCIIEHRQAAKIIAWTKDQIEAFGDLFTRQLHSTGLESQEFEECAQAALDACACLREAGMDMNFLLHDLIYAKTP